MTEQEQYILSARNQYYENACLFLFNLHKKLEAGQSVSIGEIQNTIHYTLIKVGLLPKE